MGNADGGSAESAFGVVHIAAPCRIGRSVMYYTAIGFCISRVIQIC